MKIDISKIKISDRIRTDAGDLDELANDIRENGLITPIAVTQDYELLAGWRRLNACKKLGMKEIESNVMTVEDALSKLKIEISENENRKPFTFSEKMRWVALLKEEYRKVAEENQKSNLKYSGVSSVSNDTLGRVNQKIAEEVGLGSATKVSRAEYVVQHATPDMIKALDDGQLSINAAYTSLKKINEEQQKEIDRLTDANERLQSACDLLEQQEDEASDKFDALELDRQRWYEKAQALEKAMNKTDNFTLRKEVTDVRLALRDMEEDKVAAEMTANERLREIERLKASRQSIIESFEAYKKRTVASSYKSSTYSEMVASLDTINTIIDKAASIQIEDWSKEDNAMINSIIGDLTAKLADISKRVSDSAA